MRKVLALTLLIIFGLTGCTATPPAPSPTPTLPLNQVLSAAGPGSIVRDIPYCTMGGVPLKLDVYYPESGSAPWPLVIYVHGGGWETSDKSEAAGFFKLTGMRNQSFLLASVDYRLAPQHKFPAQIEDVKCAVRYFRAHAAEYHLAPDKIGVWGGSAGGHLVALLGLADSSAGWEVGEYLDQSSRVQAVVDMFGPADLTRGSAQPGLQAKLQWDVFGSTSSTDPILATASPVTYVTADDPPFLILQGDLDELVPLEQSQILFDKLQAAGVPSELVVIRHSGHGFQQVGEKPIKPSLIKLGKIVVAFFTQHLK